MSAYSAGHDLTVIQTASDIHFCAHPTYAYVIISLSLSIYTYMYVCVYIYIYIYIIHTLFDLLRHAGGPSFLAVGLDEEAVLWAASACIYIYIYIYVYVYSTGVSTSISVGTSTSISIIIPYSAGI